MKAGQCGLNARQHKVLERLLDAGHTALGGGFLSGMTNEKYAKLTGTSKATATRDLMDLLAKGLLRVEGIGKATRYAANVPGWHQPAIKSAANTRPAVPGPHLPATRPGVFLGAKTALEQLLGRQVDLVEPGAVRNPYILASINRNREAVCGA